MRLFRVIRNLGKPPEYKALALQRDEMSDINADNNKQLTAAEHVTTQKLKALRDNFNRLNKERDAITKQLRKVLQKQTSSLQNAEQKVLEARLWGIHMETQNTWEIAQVLFLTYTALESALSTRAESIRNTKAEIANQLETLSSARKTLRIVEKSMTASEDVITANEETLDFLAEANADQRVKGPLERLQAEQQQIIQKTQQLVDIAAANMTTAAQEEANGVKSEEPKTDDPGSRKAATACDAREMVQHPLFRKYLGPHMDFSKKVKIGRATITLDRSGRMNGFEVNQIVTTKKGVKFKIIGFNQGCIVVQPVETNNDKLIQFNCSVFWDAINTA